jgi:Holliday junction resolvasome RuvABC endonuclease subunit
VLPVLPATTTRLRRTPKVSAQRYLGIDPGLTGTGIASIEITGDGVEILDARVYVPKRKYEWTGRAILVAREVAEAWRDMGRNYTGAMWCAVEMTEFFAAAHRAMGWKTGDLQRLTFLCGSIYTALAQEDGDAFTTMVRTSEWKGNLSKEQTIRRLQRTLGRALEPHDVQTHAWDALGIAMWKAGRF